MNGSTTAETETETPPAASKAYADVQSQDLKPSGHVLISTDSMVTIRLSDSTIMPVEECVLQDSPIDSPVTDTEVQRTSDSTPATTAELKEEMDSEGSILEQEVKLFQRSHRMSTISMPSIAEEEALTLNSGHIRSRSDSSGTQSSAESTHVDWEELDKSEESAPRDEGSDEVCEWSAEQQMRGTNTYSQLRFSLHGSSRRITL